MKTVLILGAGLSTGPLPVYLSQHGINVILASRTLANAEKLAKNLENVEPVEVDVTREEDSDKIESLIERCDVVISMLPYIFHPTVAKLAIKHKKHFFTTSYVSDGIKALEPEALESGVILANELGVDPGMDHMSAMRIIDDAHKNGGKVRTFLSYCGALPSPSSNDNPLGYKFSWAPRGVLLASKNGATFLKNGSIVEIKPGELFDYVDIFEIEGVGTLEGYANRNSTEYIPIFNIPEVQTLIRGTYRYYPWCKVLRNLHSIGYLSIEESSEYETLSLRNLLCKLINVSEDSNIKEEVMKFLGYTEENEVIKTMEWLELFSDRVVSARSPLDILCKIMMEKMKYREGENDMIAMQHTFEIEYEDRVEKIISRLICFGDEEGTSLAKTVSLPVAICVRFLLEGKVTLKPGINRPVSPDVYEPILDELASLGYRFVETKEVISN